MMFFAIAPKMETYAAEDIKVTINGDLLIMDQPPITENGRILVPLRAIFEGLGATVQWDSKTQSITGIKGNTMITLMIGSTSANVGNKRVVLDVPAQIVNGRTLVPVRFVAESLGAVVNWDGTKKTVAITAQVMTPELAKATAEEYITQFILVDTLLEESIKTYGAALLTLEEGIDILSTIQELNQKHKIVYDEFDGTGGTNSFTQSKFFMTSVLFNYGLVLDKTENLVKAFNEGNNTQVEKLKGEIDLFLGRMETDWENAIDFFNKEREAFKKQ